MFDDSRRTNTATAILRSGALVFHWAVRNLLMGSRYPLIAVFKSLLQSLVMIGVMFVMFTALGMRGSAVRGDFVLYLISGVGLFIVQNKAVGAVANTPSIDSAMMQHRPLNPTVLLLSSSLKSLYEGILLMIVLLGLYEAITGRVTIAYPIRSLGIFVAAWFTGICIGVMFLGVGRLMPIVKTVGLTAFRRANMIFSGKMFLANTLPGYMLAMVSWNPLFHLIDQMRGAVFINYNPSFTNMEYPVGVAAVLLVVGLILEFGASGTMAVSRGADY